MSGSPVYGGLVILCRGEIDFGRSSGNARLAGRRVAFRGIAQVVDRNVCRNGWETVMLYSGVVMEESKHLAMATGVFSCGVPMRAPGRIPTGGEVSSGLYVALVLFVSPPMRVARAL